MKDIIGTRFGRLTVIKKGKVVKYPKLTVLYYICLCNCGRKKEVKKYSLTSGLIKSCGCLRRESSKKRLTTHGLSKKKVYRIWAGIKERAVNKKMVSNNKKLSAYKNIKISKSWLKFENFYKDMGNPPSNKHQIDRIDPNGNYEKDNCRWVTASENMLNQKRNLEIVKLYRKHKPKVPYHIFKRRVTEQKWSLEKAIKNPKMKNQFI